MDRKTMDELKETFADKGRGGSTVNNYGICYREERVIYVNINKRLAHYKTYAHTRYSDHYVSKHKKTYRDFLHTMVHELVHYRFGYLQHGAKFERRIREILAGRVFPEKALFDVSDTSQ